MSRDRQQLDVAHGHYPYFNASANFNALHKISGRLINITNHLRRRTSDSIAILPAAL